MSSDEEETNIFEVFTCGICYEDFNDQDHYPYVFKHCGHTYCKQCIIENAARKTCFVCTGGNFDTIKNDEMVLKIKKQVADKISPDLCRIIIASSITQIKKRCKVDSKIAFYFDVEKLSFLCEDCASHIQKQTKQVQDGKQKEEKDKKDEKISRLYTITKLVEEKLKEYNKKEEALEKIIDSKQEFSDNFKKIRNSMKQIEKGKDLVISNVYDFLLGIERKGEKVNITEILNSVEGIIEGFFCKVEEFINEVDLLTLRLTQNSIYLTKNIKMLEDIRDDHFDLEKMQVGEIVFKDIKTAEYFKMTQEFLKDKGKEFKENFNSILANQLIHTIEVMLDKEYTREIQNLRKIVDGTLNKVY